MYKKIVALLISFTVIASGCQAPVKAPEVKAGEKNVQQAQIQALHFKVDNDGGTFSSKDLIYFIMTDRFNDGDKSNDNFSDVNKNDARAYHGGDFKGIIDKLDYIKSLGATAIWITPTTENITKGYHGYWTNDFYKVDPHLGTMDDLKALVQEAHKRNIKVLMDYVANHTGPNSAMYKEKGSDWFHPNKGISNWNDQNQLENNWLYDLPDLNQENPEVKKFLIDNALWWIDQTGIDGMRLDTVRHVPKPFWNEFANAIKTKYPDFYLLGEVWNTNPRYLDEYHKAGIDGMTDYPLFDGIKEAFVKFGKADKLVNAIQQRNQYSDPGINGIFIDNHDNKRLMTLAGDKGPEYLRQALAFIMTYPSIPIVYYGTEIGMKGGDDPDNRKDMAWDQTKNSDILAYYKKLVALRSGNAALAEGDIKLLDYDRYFFSYMREKDDKSVIVVMNLQDKEKTVTVNVPTQAIQYKDALTGKTFEVKDKKLELNLKNFEVLILESK